MNRQNTPILALGGHMLDLWDMACMRIRNPHSYTKFRQLNAVRRRTKSDTLIETGTFLGNTARRCSYAFEQVHTVELDDALYEQSSKYLSTRRNVVCHHGDAVVELPKILSEIKSYDILLFWDGHYSGGVTASTELAEPACEGLEIASRFKEKFAAIVIDDFRNFGVEDGWPRKSVLLKSIEEKFPNHRLSVHWDQVVVERQT